MTSPAGFTAKQLSDLLRGRTGIAHHLLDFSVDVVIAYRYTFDFSELTQGERSLHALGRIRTERIPILFLCLADLRQIPLHRLLLIAKVRLLANHHCDRFRVQLKR